MYRIAYEKRVCKDLDRIPEIDAVKIIKIFEELSINPVFPGTKKLSSKSGLYRAKQGNYRIVYTISHINKEVKIILVRHRKDAYRNL
jgi:mRNA interferase RelE/StbE